MQCLAGAILVILLIQNSLSQNEEDPGCGEKPRALNNYMRRLNNAENEAERPADLKNSEDPNDPKSRMGMFRYKSQTYYPSKSKSRQISIGPSSSIMMPGGHAPSSMSSFFQYGMSGSSQMNSGSFTLKYNLEHVPMDELMQRFMKLVMEWPAVKISLEMKHMRSFRDVLRAAFECMYPEWNVIKMNMIFGAVNDEAVLKNLFVAMFPHWPQREIDVIFSPTNTIPLIIRKLLLYLVPDITQKDIDFIFSNTSSVRLILQRILEVLFPSMKIGFDIFGNGNSVMHIFDSLLQGFFPQMQTFSPIQWQPVYTILFPGMAYNITSSEPNLPFLLSQFNNFQSMPMEPSKRENIMLLILLEWLKQNPHIQYKLPRPGMDDFDNFKTTFFQNAPPNTIVPREFQDDNFLRELFELWKRFVVERYPNDKQIDLQSVLKFLSNFIQTKITNPNPKPTPPSIPWQLLYPILFPGMAFNITSPKPSLPFLLRQYNNFQSMHIDPSKREIIMILILLDWLTQNPHIQYKLPRPGMDDFDNFKMTFFRNTPPNTIVPREFQDDNFLRELFELWKRIVVEHYPNDKEIDLQSILNFLSNFIQTKIPNLNLSFPPTFPSTFPPTFPPTTAAPTTLNEIPIKITIPYVENLRNILPSDIIKQLLEIIHLPDKSKSGPLIINILSNWQKYKLQNRVPLSKLMELILRIIANWPDVDVERVVGRNLNPEQILINLAKVMLLERPNMSFGEKINSPQFILEMLLKKALPHIPKEKIEAAFYGSNDMERILRSIMQLLYPNWPAYDPSSTHFDTQVLEKIISEIIDWPRIKSSIIAGGVISKPLIVESFIHAIFPSWPQYIVSMITTGRTPLPLIVQKIIQLIGTKHEDKGVVLHYDEQSAMVQISEAMFRKIFPDWPNYSAVLNIPNRGERDPVLGQLLILVQDSSTAKHENSLQCLNARDSNWAFALFVALLKYVQQESVLHSTKMF